jgi:hypothetical protein
MGEEPFSDAGKAVFKIYATHGQALNKQKPVVAYFNIKLQKITNCS